MVDTLSDSEAASDGPRGKRKRARRDAILSAVRQLLREGGDDKLTKEDA